MRVDLLCFVLLFVVNRLNGKDYNLFMPDLPSKSSSLVRRVVHPSFRRLHLAGGPMSVTFSPRSSNDTSIELEAEESVHPFIHLDINDVDQLVIRTDQDGEEEIPSLTIFFDRLDELQVDGSVDIQSSSSLSSEHFRLVTRGSGSIRLKLNVSDLDVSLHSMGRVKLCGLVHRQARIRSFGLADLQCRHLTTRRVDLLSSGLGDVFVSAEEELKINLTGLGTVYYRGPLKEQTRTGLGHLVHVESSLF